MSSNEPVKIECEVIYFKIRSSIYRYETFHISLHIVFKLFILPNTMISCNLLTIFLSLDKSNTEKLQAEESCAMTVCRFVLLICPLFQAPLLLGLLQQVTGLKISRVQSYNHFVRLIKEHFNSIWKKVQLPQEAKMQRSRAKGKFQNPMLSMEHVCTCAFL